MRDEDSTHFITPNKEQSCVFVAVKLKKLLIHCGDYTYLINNMLTVVNANMPMVMFLYNLFFCVS